MAKEDLYREAAGLGLELEDGLTNREIQKAIDDFVLTGVQSKAFEEPAAEQAEEVVEEAAPVPSDPAFTLAQLKGYTEQLFGVGYHVLVGTEASGCIPGGLATRDEWRAGIDQYLKMPVEQGKEA